MSIRAQIYTSSILVRILQNILITGMIYISMFRWVAIVHLSHSSKMSLNETVIHKIEIKGVTDSREKPSPILFRPRLLSSIAVIVDFVEIKFGVTIPYWRQFFTRCDVQTWLPAFILGINPFKIVWAWPV